MKNIIIILLSLLPLASFACVDINLYDTNRKLNELPIIKQGDMATCYAHSIAQLYNIQVAKDR